ncbi:hypothetical protein ACKAV7_008124 [Fusarium commune]
MLFISSHSTIYPYFCGKMPLPQKHPISHTKSDSEQDEWPILSTNDHELLPPREARSPDPARNGTGPSKTVREFTGLASIKRKSDRFWAAWNVYVNKPWNISSKQFDMLIATKTTLMGEAIVRKESGLEICGQGWNCSYVANFVAPGYKCQELASGVDSEVKKLGNATVPFNTSVIAPVGNRTYYAINDRGEYGDPQMSSHAGGKPKEDPPYPDNFGAFRTEPIMWIGYANVDDLSVPQPDTPGTEVWMEAYTPVIIGCKHYEVNYTAQFNYTGGAQFVDIKRREYLRKVVDTTYIPEKDPDKRLKDRTQAVPESNYIFPTDVKKCRRTAAYHSIGSGLRKYLNGTTTMPHYNVNSELLYTRLITPVNYLPIKNFRQGIQSLYEDMIISIFSEPSFSVVSWAANGKPSGIAKGAS